MSLLSMAHEDLVGQGPLLPEGVYLVQIEEAKVEQKQTGKQLARRYGSIRTDKGETEFAHNGGTFRIGNRKLFARSWIEQNNAKAQEIGNSEIMKEAIAVGLAPKTSAKGQESELNYDDWEVYASDLVGQSVKVRVKHKQRERNGEPILDDEGKTQLDTIVVAWVSAT